MSAKRKPVVEEEEVQAQVQDPNEAATLLVTGAEEAPHKHVPRVYNWEGKTYAVKRPSFASVLRIISVLAKGLAVLKDTKLLSAEWRSTEIKDKDRAARRAAYMEAAGEVVAKLTTDAPDLLAELTAVLLGHPESEGWEILEAMPPQDMFDVLADAVYAYPVEDILDHFFLALDEIGKRQFGRMLGDVLSRHTR